jgi:hypothetical protein
MTLHPTRLHPSPYERAAWAQIQGWKAARSGPPNLQGLPVRALTGRRGLTATRAMQAILPALSRSMSDVAHWHVDAGALARIRRAGGDLAALSEVHRLDLAVIDRAVKSIRTRYVPSMAAQGATAGAFGAPGMVVDLPLLVLSNLRAIGEFGTHYGVDLESPAERLWAGQLLVLGAGTTQAVRAGAILNLQQISSAAAASAGWRELEQHVLVGLLRRTARVLGIELTRQRLVRILPVIGAAVAAHGNVRLTRDTCTAAYQLYRERFLLTKYGPAAFGLVPAVPATPATAIRALGDGRPPA